MLWSHWYKPDVESVIDRGSACKQDELNFVAPNDTLSYYGHSL